MVRTLSQAIVYIIYAKAEDLLDAYYSVFTCNIFLHVWLLYNSIRSAMNNYKYILLATDFSKPAEAAAKRAAKIATCFSARLCLLHVVDHFPEDISNDWIAPEDKSPVTYMTERSEKTLEQLSSQLEYDNIETQIILSEHSAAYEIIQYAKQNKVDLIVTGRHGNHGIINMPGSTSSAVAHRAECDTLSVQSF